MIPCLLGSDGGNKENANLQSFLNEMGILLLHLTSHANLRGEVRQLDPTCQVCKVHFAEKLGLAAATAA